MKSGDKKNHTNIAWSHGQMGLSMFFSTAAGVTFIVGFFRHIGFTEFQVALYGSAIGFAGFLGMIGSWAAQRSGQYKKTVMLLYGSSAIFCLGGVLTGVFGGHGKIVVVIVLVFMALYQLPLYLGSPVILSWLNNVVGQKEWARFFSTRMAIGDGAVLAASLMVGVLLGEAPSTNDFLLVFTIACLAGLSAIYFMHRTPAPVIMDKFPDFKVYAKKIIEAMRKRETQGLLFVAFLKAFAYGLILPFQPLFLLETLHLKYTQISLLIILSTVASILCYKIWAHFQRRIGNFPTLRWNLGLAIAEPILWLLATAKNPGPVFAAYILFGFNGWQGGVNAGYWTSLTGSFFDLSDEHQKPINLAMYFLVFGIATIIAPLVSGTIVENYNFGFAIDSYRFLFLIAGAILIVTTLYAVFGRRFKKQKNQT